MKNTTLATLSLLFAAFLSQGQAGTIGVDPTSGETGLVSGFGGLTLGWEFQVTSTNGIVVDGLGFWDDQSDGFLFSQTFPVGLWDATTGTLLRSSTITSASTLKTSLDPDGDWRINSVAPLFLAPGLYRVGALLPESGANQIIADGAAIQSGPGVELVRYLRQLGSATLAMPDIGPSTAEDSYFGPTFTYTVGPLVPTPPTGLVVAPASYTATVGSSGLNTLVRDNGFPRTYQAQFSPAALGGLPAGAKIIELRFRLNTNNVPLLTFPTNTVTWPDYEVTLAQAANPIASMSTTFAANMISPVLVKDGPLSISAGSFATTNGLNPFGSLVVFDTPYVYQGGDLVMFFSHPGSDANYNAFLDSASVASPGYGTSFRAVSATTFHATTGVASSLSIAEIVFAYSIRENIVRDGTNVVIAGTGGLPGGTYRIVASTNTALPMAQWMPVATNLLFDGGGSFRYTNAIQGNLPQLFRLMMP